MRKKGVMVPFIIWVMIAVVALAIGLYVMISLNDGGSGGISHLKDLLRFGQ